LESGFGDLPVDTGMKVLYLIIPISFILSFNRSEAQINGCTDPLAVNYNQSATINDGSCIYNIGNIKPLSSFTLAGILSETSGLIFWNDHLWTQNDNADINIYCLDSINGKIIQAYPMNGIENRDWEEISQDEDFIYLGDFGNNNGNRTDLQIFRISKSSLLNETQVIDSIEFSYSDQSDFTSGRGNDTDFDCEAFVTSKDSIYLFTKQWVSNKTSVYSLSKNPGNYIAKLKSTFDVGGLITGAVYLESKRIIVLSGYSKTLDPFIYILYDFKDQDFFSGNKRKIEISLPFHQIEGIATKNGIKYYISNESFLLDPFVNVNPGLHIFDLSPFLGNYLELPIPYPDPENNFIISPVPAHDFITIRSYTDLLPVDYAFINLSGQIVKTGRLDEGYSNINISGLASGTYIIRIGGEKKNSFKIVKD
jgi:hypothetical protein